MSPEELEYEITNESMEGLVALIAPLSSSERKKLAKIPVLMKRQRSRQIEQFFQAGVQASLLGLFTGRPETTEPDADTALASWQQGWIFQSKIDLAILGLCSWGEAKKIGALSFGAANLTSAQDLVFQILSARKPDWLEKWALQQIEGTGGKPWIGFGWLFLRRLVREHLCPQPTNPQYIIRMVESNAGALRGNVLEALRADPDLLTDEIWQIFDKYPLNPSNDHFSAGDGQHEWSWAYAFAELSKDGSLDRQRLLRACLEAMGRCVNPKRTAWFWSVHETLEVSDDERQGLLSLYLKNLSLPYPAVVGSILDALTRVAKERRLRGEDFIMAVPPVFQLKPKGPPLTALKILGFLWQQSPLLGQAIAEQAIRAMSHEKQEIQKTALDLFEKVTTKPDQQLTQLLAGQFDNLQPSLQIRAKDLLQHLGGTDENAGREQDGSFTSTSEDHADLRAEANSIPEPWRQFAGIDAILSLVDSQNVGQIPSLAFDPMAVPRCDEASRLKPIQDLDELIEGLSSAVEDLKDADEFERLLDGLSRLCDQGPKDFVARTSPLFSRILHLPPRPGLGVHAGLMEMIRCWCNSELRCTLASHDNDVGILAFLWHRLIELAVRMRIAKAAPLFGCPTHRHGWIEPIALVDRLCWWQNQQMEPDKHDFIQGLLRLAPDGRDHARKAAADLPGEAGAALRYALGGEHEPELKSLSFLLAAARARQPYGDLRGFDANPSFESADGRPAAQYTWEVKEPVKTRFPHDDENNLYLFVSVSPYKSSFASVVSRPTMLLHREGQWSPLNVNRWSGSDRATLRWVASAWPHNRDALYSAGAMAVVARLNKTASPYFANSAFLEPLLESDTAFTEVSQLLLAVSLASRDADVAGLAVDVLIQVIADGRCGGQELGQILGRLLEAGLVKPVRLANILDTTAKASLLHMHVCGQIVQVLLGTMKSLPRDTHHFLTVLNEWLIVLDQPLAESLRHLLEGSEVCGKTGTLARKLIQRTGETNRDVSANVLCEALRGRIMRARQWSARQSGPNRALHQA